MIPLKIGKVYRRLKTSFLMLIGLELRICRVCNLFLGMSTQSPPLAKSKFLREWANLLIDMFPTSKILSKDIRIIL